MATTDELFERLHHAEAAAAVAFKNADFVSARAHLACVQDYARALIQQLPLGKAGKVDDDQ